MVLKSQTAHLLQLQHFHIVILQTVFFRIRPSTLWTRPVPLPASVPRSVCSISRVCMNIIRARSRSTVRCSACRPLQSTGAEKRAASARTRSAKRASFVSVEGAKVMTLFCFRRFHGTLLSCIIRSMQPRVLCGKGGGFP